MASPLRAHQGLSRQTFAMILLLRADLNPPMRLEASKTRFGATRSASFVRFVAKSGTDLAQFASNLAPALALLQHLASD